MAASTEQLLVRIDATTEQLRRELALADKKVETFGGRVKNTLSKFNARFQEATKAAAKFGVAMGAAGAAATAGIVKSGLQTVDTLAKTADKLGVTTEALAKYRFAAQQTGVAQNQADIALQRFTRRLADAAEGAGPAVKAFDALGLSAEELVKLSPDQAFSKVADAMGGVSSQTKKVQIAFKLFDSQGVNLVNTLAAGSDGLEEFGEQAEAAGLTLSRFDAAKVEAANDSLARVSSTMSGFSQQLAVKFAPAIEAVSNEIFGIGKDAGGMAKMADKAFRHVIKAVGFLGDAIVLLQVGWEGMKIAFQGAAKYIFIGLDELTKGAIRMWNALPWTDEREVSSMFSGFVETMTSEMEQGQRRIDEILSRPLPSDALERWEAAQVEATGAVVQSYEQIPEAAEVAEVATESLATTTIETAKDVEVAAEQVETAWDKAITGTIERLDSAFADAWAGSFDSFKDFASNMKDAFRSLLGELAHMAITRPIIMQIGAAMGLGGGAAGAAAGVGGGGGGLLSGAASIASGGFGALTSGYQWAGQQLGAMGLHGPAGAAYNAAGQYGGSLGSSLGNLGLNLGAGVLGGFAGNAVFGSTSGIGAGVGGLAGSIFGPVGTGIGSFLGSGLERALGNVFGFGGKGGNQAGAAEFNTATGLLNAYGIGNSFDQANVDTASGLAQALQALTNIVGGSGVSGRIKVGSRSGIKMDGKSYSSPAEFLDQMFDDIIEGADDLSDSVRELLLGFEGTAEQTMQFAQAIMALDESSSMNSVAQAIEDFNAEIPTALQSYEDQSSSIRELIKDFDGSADAAMQLNGALAMNKQAAYEMTIAILQMADQLTAAGAEQASYFRESVMSSEQLRVARRSERNALREGLKDLTDPQEIEEATKRILELNRLIFDSLTGDEKTSERAEDFARYAENTALIADKLLDRALNNMQQTQEDLNTRMANLLENAGRVNYAAAELNYEAAVLNYEAAGGDPERIRETV